jgi:hypothetical protein
MSQPKKTLILHIGMGKTGTTAIQKAMWRNRAALSRAGIAYPVIGAVAGAHHLISPHLPSNILGRTNWKPLPLADWIAQVAALPEPRVLMSSELISSAEPAAVAALCAALTPRFDLHVCIYLRRQDEIIAASYAQGVRGGVQPWPLEKILAGDFSHYDYMERIAPWEKALGRDRLIIRPYERGQFLQGDLVRDFLFRALGLADLPEGFVHDPHTNANTRLSTAATEIKRLINTLVRDTAKSRHYIEPLSACPPDPKGTHLLGRGDRARLIALFAESNARIAQTYLDRPAGDLFQEPLDPAAPESAHRPGPEDLRDAAVVLGKKAPVLFHLLDQVAAQTHSTAIEQQAATQLRDILSAAALDNERFVPELWADVQSAQDKALETRRLESQLRAARARSKAFARTKAFAAEPAKFIATRSSRITGPLRAARLATLALRSRAARTWRALRTGRPS